MINNPKLIQKIGETKPSTLPDMYDSPLFKRKHPNCKGSQYSKGVKDEEMNETLKAIKLLEEFSKAGMSAGKESNPSEIQAKREYDHSFARYGEGESGVVTPDLPDRGRDWHGTVPGVPDEPQVIGKDEQTEAEEDFQKPKPILADKSKSINDLAIKSLASLPYFEVEPEVPPREIDFLVKSGYSEDMVTAGEIYMNPILRSQFNKTLLSAVKEAVKTLKEKI